MISLKRFLDQNARREQPGEDVLQAALQMGRLLIEAITANSVRGRDADYRELSQKLKSALRKADQSVSALSLLEIASEVQESLENYSHRTEHYFREQNQQMQSMVGMLTDTLTEISGEADASATRLQAIERQIERASRLEDMQALSVSLEGCLEGIREAAAQHRRAAATTVQRLRLQLAAAKERSALAARAFDASQRDVLRQIEAEHGKPAPPAPVEYVAVVKLQHAEHIATRFGDEAKLQMLSLIGQGLKGLLGPNDRLLRWKGTSYVVFLRSAAPIVELRTALGDAVSRTREHYIELGKKSVLLAVSADWTIFPQMECASLDAVFSKVDAFIENAAPGGPTPRAKGE